jgi:hypothetical protein
MPRQQLPVRFRRICRGPGNEVMEMPRMGSISERQDFFMGATKRTRRTVLGAFSESVYRLGNVQPLSSLYVFR